MQRSLSGLLLTGLMALLVGSASWCSAAPSDDGAPDRIAKAIERDQAFLLRMQGNDGWSAALKPGDADVVKARQAELTARVVTSLIESGIHQQRPEITRALALLQQADPSSTSANVASLQMLRLIYQPSDEQKRKMKRAAELILHATRLTGDDAGLYSDSLDPNKGEADPRLSNDGSLALALVNAKFEIPNSYWQLIDKTWRVRQSEAGAWNDPKSPNGGVSLSAAGVATLLLTRDTLDQNRFIRCNGNPHDAEIERGLKWLADHAADFDKDSDPIYLFEQLDRIGQIAGVKYFGSLDWRRHAAEYLLKRQQADGSWTGPKGAITATAGALQFLARQRDPIMISKLQYNIEKGGRRIPGNWNQRPADIAHLVQWIGPELCYFNAGWQVVNLEMSENALHEAPILYIAGDQELNFTHEEKSRLKLYVQQGGLILGHADCGNSRFVRSFEQLGQELFPACVFADLPRDHLIYKGMLNAAKPTNPSALQELSNGARSLMVIIVADDPSAYWQAKVFRPGKPRTFAELAGCLYRNADFRYHPRIVDETDLPRRDDRIRADKTIQLARLQYNGNWDPEPYGWVRLSNVMHNQRKFDINVQSVPLGKGKLSRDFTVAHLTGTGSLQLTAGQRNELKQFVEEGGTLIVDSTGGDKSFAQSAQAELSAIFDDKAQELTDPLAQNHAIFSNEPGAFSRLIYRPFANLSLGEVKAPRIRGIKSGNRTAVFFSSEDLSVGLLGTDLNGIIGYQPRWCTEFMANMIAYAASQTHP